MTELPHRPGLPKDSPLVGVSKKRHQPRGLMTVPGQPEPGEAQTPPCRVEPEHEPEHAREPSHKPKHEPGPEAAREPSHRLKHRSGPEVARESCHKTALESGHEPEQARESGHELDKPQESMIIGPTASMLASTLERSWTRTDRGSAARCVSAVMPPSPSASPATATNTTASHTGTTVGIMNTAMNPMRGLECSPTSGYRNRACLTATR